ncbi:PREDICTED: uncharacterized protein C4orf50 homolog [Chinchilla lanigera]|uniref:uncharacterized protein C4orf50 homolog n=1 Tax=Chinchilla lanigera TaxID=34839 RepID=UPI00038E9CF7|nr:PREDICTED: uncharacterized protein C4orf50 homolog [Chinchilla lanigera]
MREHDPCVVPGSHLPVLSKPPHSGCRVQELELAERKLLRRVDALSTRLVQERSAGLRAHEQLRALQMELASRVREEELTAQRQREQLWRWRERLRRKDEALGLQAAALERCRQSQRRQLCLVRGQERVLRAQVQRLERDVRRLCRATGLLLAQLGPPARGLGTPKASAEPHTLSAGAERTEREGAEAVRRLREHRAREHEPRGQLEELRGRVSGLRLSEIGLRGCEEELAEQKRGLREQPGAGHSSLASQGCMQDDSAPPCRQQDPCGSRGQQEEAQGPGPSAGQLSEGPCSYGCVGDGEDPRVMVPALEATSEFPGDRAGSDCEQLSLAEHSLHGQVLLLVCGCPPGQSVEASLLPLDLAQVSESLEAIQEPCVLVQPSTLPLSGPAGDAVTLLPLPLQEASAEGLQAQEELDTRPPPAPEPTAHSGWGCHRARSRHVSLCQEATCPSNHLLLRTGPTGHRDTWTGGGGTPGGTAEEGEARRTSGRAEGKHGAKWQLGQEGCEDLSPGSVARAPEGGQHDTGAPETLATVCCPWLQQDCPVALLQGATLEGPQPLSKSGKVEGCGLGPPEGLSSSEEEAVLLATGSRARGTGAPKLTAGRGRAPQRMLRDEKDRKPHLGRALPLQEERAQEGPEEEEKVLPGDASILGHSHVPGQPNSQALVGQEVPSCAGEHSLPQPPSLAVPATRCEAASSPLGEGDRCALQIDEFEREVEACFRQLHTLQLGSGGHRGKMSAPMEENWSFAPRWRSSGEDCTYSQWDLASQGWDACLAAEAEPKVHGEGVRLRKTAVLCPSRGVPGTAPTCHTASPDPAEPRRALERARDRFQQLLSALKKERRQVLYDNVILRGDQDRCRRKVCDLEKARVKDAAEMHRLEQVNRELVVDLAHLQGKLGPCLQAISDLEDCNRESYGKIVQLEEENEKLKGELGQLQEAVSERRRESRGVADRVTLDSRELKVLTSQLGVRYKELIKHAELAIEDTLRALKKENEHLLCRVRGLERMSSDMGVSVRGGQHPQGDITRTGDELCTVDKEVQVGGTSGQLILGARGPPSEEDVGVCGGRTGPSSDVQDCACGADPPSPSSLWSNAAGPGTQQGSIDGAGGKEARVGKEEKRQWCSVDQGRALRRLGNGLQDAEAQVAEEDLRLCVQRLCHQVQTLQCQLRDQRWANRALQAARDQAVHLQEELSGKLEELRREQREARLAVSPLKAKLASLVQKCLDRNRLIMRLLQELCRHGPASPSLSELAQSMVHDVALMEYTATFLTPGVTGTSHRLDVDSEDAAAGREPMVLGALACP